MRSVTKKTLSEESDYETGRGLFSVLTGLLRTRSHSRDAFAAHHGLFGHLFAVGVYSLTGVFATATCGSFEDEKPCDEYHNDNNRNEHAGLYFAFHLYRFTSFRVFCIFIHTKLLTVEERIKECLSTI